MSIPVVTVGDSRDDLVEGLERLHGPVSVVRRCSELAELLAACQSGLARAAVVATGSEELTASLVDRLSAVGVVVIALTDNPGETARLRTIGVAAEASGVDAAALAARIAVAVAQLSRTGGRPGPAAADGDTSGTSAGTDETARTFGERAAGTQGAVPLLDDSLDARTTRGGRDVRDALRTARHTPCADDDEVGALPKMQL